jgi:cytochrome P450
VTGTTGKTTTETADEIPEFPMARAAGCPFDPPPALRSIQAQTAITKVRLWDGSTPWLVTRYAEQRALLTDPRISADTTHPGYPHASPAQRARRAQARTFISMDNPEHGRLRRMVTAAFTVKRVEALRPAVQRIVDDLIDQMLARPRPVDLVQMFALPVPSLVICELLGVPYGDHEFFQQTSKILISRASTPQAAQNAQQQLICYLEDLTSEKLARPGEDLLSRLAVQRVATGALSRHDVAVMGQLLLVAGHETTANMIALGTLALLEHPDQLAELRDSTDPALVAGAVEELLRYLHIVHSGRRRVALEDIDINGTTVRAGDGVILANDVANRDEDVFPEADRLNIHRDARRHVAFGFGVHQCLGQSLARLELQVVFSTLYHRIPTLRLAVDLDQVPFKHDALVYGVYELPVSW